jgi:hypothetical protein
MGRLSAGEEVPDQLECPSCQVRRPTNAGPDYISLGLDIVVYLVGVVGESRVEWDTEVVSILSEGEWLKFVDFFDLLNEILVLDGFVGFVDVVVKLGPELERLLPEE